MLTPVFGRFGLSHLAKAVTFAGSAAFRFASINGRASCAYSGWVLK
jgi:hypothetical protein